jgi:hypothetical protein
MLPVFGRSRKAMRDLWRQHLFKNFHGGDPVMTGIPLRVQREGKNSSFEDAAGERQEMEYKQISAESSFKPEEGKGMSTEEFFKMASEPAIKMAGQASRRLFEKLAQVTSATGQVIDAKGQPFHPKLMIEMLEKMELSFDDQGNPRLPEMYMGPDLHSSIKDKLPEWEKDETIKAAMKEVIDKKREDFREREANRRLVD